MTVTLVIITKIKALAKTGIIFAYFVAITLVRLSSTAASLLGIKYQRGSFLTGKLCG